MGNILKYELKMYRKSVLIWIVSIGILIGMFLAIYPTFAKDASLMEQIIENYPEELLKAFGMSGGLSLSSVPGFLVFVYVFVQLCLAIQSSNYGFGILSIEEREFTADFLLSKPVSRQGILNAKLGASIIAILITNLIVAGLTVLFIEIFKDEGTYELDRLMLLFGATIVFSITFFSIGILTSVLVRKIKNVLTFSMGLAFGTYILNAVRAIIGGETLGYISPFYHFEPTYILEFGEVDWSLALISIGVIIISFIVVYLKYPTRDIHSL